MKVIRRNKIVRSDPEANPKGTPLEKTVDADLGTNVIPKERYTSKDFMRKEWEGIWTKVWLLGCREDQIPDPGDYICTNIGTESVVIVRQHGCGFKAFHNVCMHRGNRLADEGLGHADPFVCGYHGWHDWFIANTDLNSGIPDFNKQLAHSFKYNDLDSLEKIFQDFLRKNKFQDFLEKLG